MSEHTVRVDSLPEEIVTLLRAVHDALDIPSPGLTEEDERAHALLLEQRVTDARIVLACLLHKGHEVGPAAESLRAWTAERPVTYAPWAGGGVA
ncbi:hypothetical protein [Streptomyces sp. NPDC001601]|uniref:hypothetical protein n=1 Tax=Streptomyces sp. NPDC001601 TaxID=3364592 RepID=UPI0036CB8D00